MKLEFQEEHFIVFSMEENYNYKNKMKYLNS